MPNLNKNGLRYDGEFVKHKMLDAIGDLYVAGYPLIAAYTAYKSSHRLNNALLRAYLLNKTLTKSSPSATNAPPHKALRLMCRRRLRRSAVISFR